MELVPPDDDVSLLLVEPGVVPLLLVEPGVLPPLLLVLEPGVVVLPVELPPIEVLPPLPVLPGEPLDGLVVDELEDDVPVVPVSSRFVHAPSETAAMSASAAHEVRVAFIRETP
jgi:hypothetical protein